MNQPNTSKFSVFTYSHRLKNDWPTVPAKLECSSDASHLPYHFQQLVEEMREFLATSKGKSDGERMMYSEKLNRAILGFTEDKEHILAMIQDELIKKRIHELPPPHPKYKTLAEALFAEIIGLNVLELILKNKEGLEEIQVVGKRIFEVRHGQTMLSSFEFQSVRDVERIQQNLLLFNDDTMNPKKKWSEAMLSDGSRVTLTGFGFTGEPTLTIRFFTMRHFDLDALCHPRLATINELMKELLLSIIRSRFNMIVIGSTNTGKTNLIKAFIGEMPDHERIITIESRREMMLKRDFPQKNIIEYEVDEEDPYHSSQQAFKLALRQSPQRIIHAEIREEDANIYVRACTRGHEGSITTVHANTLEDVPETLTDMCMLDQRGMNPDRLTKRITQYVTQIGFEMSLIQGKRKMTRIAEFSYENGEVMLNDLVVYNRLTDEWEFPGKFSVKSTKRIFERDPDGYKKLLALGLVEPC